MAYGRKCYCCGVDSPASPELFYCKSCLLKLSKIFKENRVGILGTPQHFDHCISCGAWEGRRIVYTGHTGLFFEHTGDGVPVCDHCVEKELKLILE